MEQQRPSKAILQDTLYLHRDIIDLLSVGMFEGKESRRLWQCILNMEGLAAQIKADIEKMEDGPKEVKDVSSVEAESKEV